jgi:hypothetical protein
MAQQCLQSAETIAESYGNDLAWKGTIFQKNLFDKKICINYLLVFYGCFTLCRFFPLRAGGGYERQTLRNISEVKKKLASATATA